MILTSLMFIVGFSISFIALGATASAVGQVLLTRRWILQKIAGMIMIVFGLHVLGIFRLNFLYQDKRMHNVQNEERDDWCACTGSGVCDRLVSLP